jgi:transposase
MIIWRALKKLGITRKKKTQHAAEQDRPEVQEQWKSFRKQVQRIEPGRLVFVDETGVTTVMTPTYGRAPRGERVLASAPASWESMTGIAALGLDGVRAPWTVSGVSNGTTFLTYVEQVLVPALRAGDVVIFDNLASHFAPGVAEAIAKAGARVMPLPPYSPDLNPIEELFSKVKEFLRRIGARTKDHLVETIGDALQQISAQDILGWFQQAGLCVTQT